MLLEHASYAYPSHRLILFEVALAVLLLVQGIAAPGWNVRLLVGARAKVLRLTRRPRWAVALLFLVGAGGNAASHVALGPPLPATARERSGTDDEHALGEPES